MAEPRMFTVACPWPDMAKLSLNARPAAWPQTYRAREERKTDVIALIRERSWWEDPIEQGKIGIIWRAPDKRRRDLDNLFSCLKPDMDALVHTGVIKDDNADRFQFSLNYQATGEGIVQITVQEWLD